MDTSSSTTKVRFTVLVISLISLKSLLIGVFLSCAEVGVNILDPEDILLECYYRTSYASNTISKVYLDGNFHIASDIELEIMEGQDPRVFDWKGKVHVTDNIAFNNKIK